MTDQIQEQDVELDLNNEVVEEAHDPKNAEAQSIDSVDKAGEVTAKAARGDASGNTAKIIQSKIQHLKLKLVSLMQCIIKWVK